MDNCKIVKQFTKFIYPFKYEKDDPQNRIEITETTSKGNVMPVWERCGIDGHELREGISDFFSKTEDECSARIAHCYSLKYRVALGLPNNEQDRLTFVSRVNRECGYKVKITDVRLYLFESEVGFGEITCEYESSSVVDYIDCNYFISEIKSDKNYFTFTKRGANAEETEIKISVKELWLRILKYVDGIEFFDNAGKEFCEKKPVIYSYLLLDKKPDDLQTILFTARKNYKGSYKIPQSEYNIDANPYLYQTFENSYWATSHNGVVNVSFLVDDERTNDFFKAEFLNNRLPSSYLHLFLSVLHQKYAVRRLLAEMGELDCAIHPLMTDENDDTYSEINRQLTRARELHAQSASLKFRAFFKVPSNIEHINKYFNMISDTYEIDTIYNGFNADINSIVSICDDYILRKKSYEDEAQKFRKEKVEVLVALFGPLVAFVAVYDFSLRILEKTIGKSFVSIYSQVSTYFDFLLLPIVAVTLILLPIFIAIVTISIASRYIGTGRLAKLLSYDAKGKRKTKQ